MYEAVLAFEDYPLWWPRKFHPRFQPSQLPDQGHERVGDRLAFTPVPGIWTGWEITAVTPMEQIRVAYFQAFIPAGGCGDLLRNRNIPCSLLKCGSCPRIRSTVWRTDWPGFPAGMPPICRNCSAVLRAICKTGRWWKGEGRGRGDQCAAPLERTLTPWRSVVRKRPRASAWCWCWPRECPSWQNWQNRPHRGR